MRESRYQEKQFKALDKTKDIIKQIRDDEEAMMIIQHLIASYCFSAKQLRNR